MTWRCLKDDPPIGVTNCVILFPVRSDCGIFYTASNPDYARVTALKSGFTHWMEIPPAPDHDALKAWQDDLREEEAKEFDP